jgi:hypothetical protein
MYFSSTLYQIEHIKTARQQREEDITTGELAADLGRLWQSLAHPRNGGASGSHGGWRGFREAPEIEMLTEASAVCSCSSAAPGVIDR